MANEAARTAAVEQQSGVLPLVFAAGVHLGLLALCVSAVYTTEPYPSALSYPNPDRLWLGEPSMIALVGAALVFIGVVHRARWAAWASGSVPKVALIIGVCMAARVATLPTLDIVLPSVELPRGLSQEQGLPSVAIAVVAVFGLLWYLAGGARGEPLPFVREVLAAALGLVVLVFALRYGLVAAGYDTEKGVLSPLETGYLVAYIIGYAVLCVVASGISAARGFGRWPLLYVGLALIGHAARALLAVQQA